MNFQTSKKHFSFAIFIKHFLWFAFLTVVFRIQLSHAQDAQADTLKYIKTRSGEVYSGYIQAGDDSATILKTRGGELVTIPRQQIDEILMMKSSFPIFGVTFLTPAIVQLLGGYSFDSWLARAAIGYLPNTSFGFEICFGKNLSRSYNFSQNISVGFTSTRYTERGYDGKTIRRWNGGFIGYDFNWGGFFLETGLSFGKGDFRSPQLLLQLGYVYELKWR